MKRCRSLEEKTKTVSGKEITDFMGVNVGDYSVLYPNKPNGSIGHYCPCIDLEIGGDCHGMVTVMEVLTRNEIKEFPIGTAKISDGDYKSGDVWIDKSSDIAYLYIGQSPRKKDVVLNLGGDTFNKGNIEIGNIIRRGSGMLFFDRKIFPKKL